MSASRSSLGAVTLVLALAGIVAAAESSPSSPAAYVSLDSASVFADSSREMSPDSLLPISASADGAKSAPTKAACLPDRLFAQ
jgi:hypothetical protein